MTDALDELDRFVSAVTSRVPWWVWPAFLVALAAATLGLSWLFAPAPGESVVVLGQPWGAQCAFLEATGVPCPQCGMTRAWVHAARGRLVTAFLYNPAGAALWAWLLAAGAVGAARLATRRPRVLSPPMSWLTALVIAWIVLYAGGWFLRAFFAVNPLP